MIKKQTVSFSASLEMVNDLEMLADKKGLTKSGLIKMALSAYIDQQKTLEHLGGDTQKLIAQLEKITQNLESQDD